MNKIQYYVLHGTIKAITFAKILNRNIYWSTKEIKGTYKFKYSYKLIQLSTK
jgi:hypothetical protein